MAESALAVLSQGTDGPGPFVEWVLKYIFSFFVSECFLAEKK